ncbi:MAG: glutathione binding-like protein [Pseudomonadota bacterium]
MIDLFQQMAEKAGVHSEGTYGMSGDMKKTQYVLELIGSPADPDTLKCIITAAEQGMELNCYSCVTDKVPVFESELENISPLSIVPCMKEADFQVCGSDAITAFIDARGLGYSLTPRNAFLASIQNYWVDIACSHVAPEVCIIVNEVINKNYINEGYSPDRHVIEECLQNLDLYFDALNDQLKNNKYIVCNKYTWADLHWTAYVHLCVLSGYEDLVSSRSHVSKWFGRIQSKKSQCGQNIVAYDYLPTKEEIGSGKIKSIEINDY